ncbi:MAG: hypothetical protein ABJD11_05880 [Gemmatimonadota bacterium]
MTSRGIAADRVVSVIATDDLAVGMVVAEDVADQQGRLLLGAGTTLTERHLRAFLMWGIRGIRVRGADDEEIVAPLPVSAERLAEAEELLRPHFQHCEMSDPVIAELFMYCALREAQHPGGRSSHA